MRDIAADAALLIGTVLIGMGAVLRFGAIGLIFTGALIVTGALLYARGS